MTLDVASLLAHRAAWPPSATPARGDEDALTALVAQVGDDLDACNRTIVARMDSPVALIPQLAAHIVAAGGKRLRPLLTLAAARLCGYPGPAAIGERHVAPRRLRRVHPHRDAAARRRGGRKRCCAAAWPPPTPCSATRPPCWSAISCSPAPSS